MEGFHSETKSIGLRRKLLLLPFVRSMYAESWHKVPVRLRGLNWWIHHLAGTAAPFNVHYASRVIFGDRILFGANSKASFALSHGCYFNARNGLEIGEDFLFAPGVTMVTANHDLSDRNAFSIEKPTVIGNNVWLGARAVILPSVRIGDDATVAAGAVVTSDVSAGATVAGVPARPLS